MIFDPPPPPPGLKCAAAGPIHAIDSHIKFGWISPNGFGGDIITDRRTDGGDNNIPFAFLTSVWDNKSSIFPMYIYLTTKET